MFNKLVFKPKVVMRIVKPQTRLYLFKSLIYWKTIRFGILEDKLKEVVKETFNRIKIAKGRQEEEPENSKFATNNLKVFGSSTSNMHEFSISGMTLDEVILRLKTALE